MESLIHSASVLSVAAVTSLIAAVWEGAVLAVVVALCMRFLPRLSAASRSVIWLNVFLLLVLLHIVPSFKGQIGIGQSAHASPVLLRSGFGLLIAALWVVLSLWRGVQLVLSALRLHRLVQRATPIHADEPLRALLQGNGNRGAQLCSSALFTRAFCCLRRSWRSSRLSNCNRWFCMRWSICAAGTIGATCCRRLA